MVTLIASTVAFAAAFQGPSIIDELLGSPHQHDHLEVPFFESDFEERFPSIAEVLRKPFHEIKSLYGISEETGEVWSDPACPAFLINEDITICGNLVVRGRLTLVTAANTSVFEDFAEEAAKTDANTYRTTRLSVFAQERCTKAGPTDPKECFGDGGSIFVPSGSLLVSGRMTVLGSIFATTVTMDSASALAVGMASFLGLSSLPRDRDETHGPTETSPPRNAKIKSRRARQHSEARSTVPLIPTTIMPPHPARDDYLCEHRLSRLPEALFMPRGMLFMRNNAALFTFGRSVIRTVGLDKGAIWLSRCSSVVIADEDGGKGDMALLAGSSAFISGAESVVSVGSLAVMDGSTLGLHGTLEAKELLKVATAGVITVGGSLQAFDVAAADGGVLSVIRSSVIKDLAMLSGGDLYFGNALDVLSVEAYDNAKLAVVKYLTILEYLVADDGAAVLCQEGNLNAGALLLSNHSSLIMQGQRSTLTVGEDIKAKNGVSIEVSAVNVGCSVILDQHSTIEVSGEMRIRNHDFSTPRNSIILPHVQQTSPMACLREQPVLMLQKSTLRVNDAVSLGARRVYAQEDDQETKPMVVLITQSIATVGSYRTSEGKHALVLKGESKMDLSKSSAVMHSVFIPGKMVTLEGASLLRAIGVDIVQVGLLEIRQSSRALFGTGLFEADWIVLAGRSTLEVMANTELLLSKGMDVSDHSLADIEGTYQAGPKFDHVLAQGGSVVRWGGKCQPRQDGSGDIQLRGQHVAQDKSELFFDGLVTSDSARAAITVETRSIARFQCMLEPKQIEFRQTPESNIIVPASNTPIRPFVYLLKVSPTDAASLKAFNRDSATHQAMHRKSTFWESWQKALDNEKDRAVVYSEQPVQPLAPPTSPPVRPKVEDSVESDLDSLRYRRGARRVGGRREPSAN